MPDGFDSVMTRPYRWERDLLVMENVPEFVTAYADANQYVLFVLLEGENLKAAKEIWNDVDHINEYREKIVIDAETDRIMSRETMITTDPYKPIGVEEIEYVIRMVTSYRYDEGINITAPSEEDITQP